MVEKLAEAGFWRLSRGTEKCWKGRLLGKTCLLAQGEPCVSLCSGHGTELRMQRSVLATDSPS